MKLHLEEIIVACKLFSNYDLEEMIKQLNHLIYLLVAYSDADNNYICNYT